MPSIAESAGNQAIRRSLAKFDKTMVKTGEIPPDTLTGKS